MRVIDQSLMDAFRHYTSAESNSSPHVVDEKEARDLVETARDISAAHTSCCGLKKSHRGEKDLQELLLTNAGQFDAKAKNVINFWLTNHRLPPEENSTTPSNITPNDPATSPDSVRPTRREEKIGSWHCEKKTWHCHWFPQQERTQPGGDPTNNLFAKGGALDRYDQVFGRHSCEFERTHRSKRFDAGAEFYWWGSCDLASKAAALLEKPRFSVWRNGVEITPHLMSGLLVSVVASLVSSEVEYFGRRYYTARDDLNDPKPTEFLAKMKEWGYKAAKPEPFVIDIKRNEIVFQYPFDNGDVYASDQPPEGFNASALPRGGKIKYYRAELSGTEFDEQKRNYQFWIRTDEQGVEKESGWIQGEDAEISPDFGWQVKPKGDLTKREFWVTDTRVQKNPYVLAEEVYDVYMESIGRAETATMSA